MNFENQREHSSNPPASVPSTAATQSVIVPEDVRRAYDADSTSDFGRPDLSEDDLRCFKPGCPLNEYVGQDIDGIDNGVAMLAKAIYTIAASLRSENELLTTLDAVLWTDTLALLLKTAMGHTCSLFSADELDRDVLPGEGIPRTDEYLWRPPKDGQIQVRAACDTLSRQLTYLAQLEIQIDEAAKRKFEEMVSNVRRGRCISDVLHELLRLSISQDQKIKRLEAEKQLLENSSNMMATTLPKAIKALEDDLNTLEGQLK